VHLSAVVIETVDLEAVEQEILQLDEEALVVFDVDYTLLVSNDCVLGPAGEKYRQEFNRKWRDHSDWERLISKILIKSQSSLVDEKVLSLIETLKKKKIKTMALTAMSTGKIGLIPNAVEWRINQLDSLGVNFDWSFPSLDAVTFHEFKAKGSPPVFKQGVLASSSYPKGEVLIAFLREIGWKPSKVIFVDDRIEYIQSVELELGKKGIPLISFHYLGATSTLLDLDHQLADFQLDYLWQHGEWLSDEEARHHHSKKM
jgi:hypothetical protein